MSPSHGRSNANGSSKNEHSASTQSCPLCPEENLGENLLGHLEQNHAEEIAFECLHCEELVAGGLKMFILHQMMYHPDNPPIKLLGAVKIWAEPEVKMENDSPPINVECPFCEKSETFEGKYALKGHVEEFHGEKLDVQSLVDSLKFVAEQQSRSKNEDENDSSFERDPLSISGSSSRNDRQSASSSYRRAKNTSQNYYSEDFDCEFFFLF